MTKQGTTDYSGNFFIAVKVVFMASLILRSVSVYQYGGRIREAKQILSSISFGFNYRFPWSSQTILSVSILNNISKLRFNVYDVLAMFRIDYVQRTNL